MCITNPLKISDFQGNLLHMLLFSQKHAFYFSILRIKEGLLHVQQPLFLFLRNNRHAILPMQKSGAIMSTS